MRKPWTKPLDPPEDGKIHLICPICYKRALNMPKQPEDPDGASVLRVPCDAHDEVNQPETWYYDMDGNEVDWRPKAGMPVYEEPS